MNHALPYHYTPGYSPPPHVISSYSTEHGPDYYQSVIPGNCPLPQQYPSPYSMPPQQLGQYQPPPPIEVKLNLRVQVSSEQHRKPKARPSNRSQDEPPAYVASKESEQRIPETRKQRDVPKKKTEEMPKLEKLSIAPKKSKKEAPKTIAQERSPLLMGVSTLGDIGSSAAMIPTEKQSSSRHVLIWHPCTAVLVCIDTKECQFDASKYCARDADFEQYFIPVEKLKLGQDKVHSKPLDTWKLGDAMEEEMAAGKMKQYYIPKSCADVTKEPSHTQKRDRDDCKERLPARKHKSYTYYRMENFENGNFYLRKS